MHPKRADEAWDDLVRDGRQARNERDGAQWKLGDLALQACPLDEPDRYGKNSLARYAEEIEVNFATLSEYRRVANAYEHRARARNLTWSHHLAVATWKDRIDWLAKAETEGWTAQKLSDERISLTFGQLEEQPTIEQVRAEVGDRLPADFFDGISGSVLARYGRQIKEIAAIEDETTRLTTAMRWVQEYEQTGELASPNLALRPIRVNPDARDGQEIAEEEEDQVAQQTLANLIEEAEDNEPEDGMAGLIADWAHILTRPEQEAKEGAGDAVLREHDVTLRAGAMVLRPLTENDWETLLIWEDDPEVLYYSEGGDVTGHTVESLQRRFRPISQHAFCFIIERDGEPVGECWLQEMNLPRILEREGGNDCRRIDIALARAAWGHGLGSASVRLLLEFGFDRERADAVFACDVGDYNERSRRLWRSLGLVEHGRHPQPPGRRARTAYDFVMRREHYLSRSATLPA